MLCYFANLKNPACEFYMNGTRCTEKLHIWYPPTRFLESPSKAESYFTGINPRQVLSIINLCGSFILGMCMITPMSGKRLVDYYI